MIAIRSKEDPYNSIVSGFCTGAVLASRGGAKAAMASGFVGGVLLAVIEGLNIALTRMFANMPPPEPLPVADSPEAAAAVQQDLPWWAKPFAPPPPKPEVDFSDPKELDASPAFSEPKDDFAKTEKKWASPVEPQLDTKQLFMLIRSHAFALGHNSFPSKFQRE
mmetsp:Transcript_10632/g.16663  ORF Transcript_10632/g.16663 Transcript_10632/m.16663 type:complete len:164 (-) Transcript_10632:597-1088(-)